MKAKITSLHDELAKRLPFVAFEIESMDHTFVTAHAIEDGALFRGESQPIDTADIETMDWKKWPDMNPVDRLGDHGPRMTVDALEELAEAFDVDGGTYQHIHSTIDWLRSIY